MSFFNSRPVKAVRKRHACFWCGSLVIAGDSAVYESWMFDGDFCTGYFHPECASARDEHTAMARHYATHGCYVDEAEYGEWEHSRGRIDEEALPPQFYPDGSRTDVPILELEDIAL